MEFLLLAKIGVAIDIIVRTGYMLTGSYVVKTAIAYVQDYRESVAKEKSEVK